jgi:hypothetical protein
VACGETIARSEAREYDKHGDRWERAEKSFEYLCKPCFRTCCHQPRDGLEERLVGLAAGERDTAAFLAAFCDREAEPPAEE